MENEKPSPKPARFTIETAFGSVEPRQRPEDFDELSRKAKAAKAKETVDKLSEEKEPDVTG